MQKETQELGRYLADMYKLLRMQHEMLARILETVGEPRSAQLLFSSLQGIDLSISALERKYGKGETLKKDDTN